jgi:hypothetical protein
MRREVRRWGLQNRTDTALDDLARRVNPYIRGWINYYSHFYKSALYDSLRRIDSFASCREVRAKSVTVLAGDIYTSPAGSRGFLPSIVGERASDRIRLSGDHPQQGADWPRGHATPAFILPDRCDGEAEASRESLLRQAKPDAQRADILDLVRRDAASNGQKFFRG